MGSTVLIKRYIDFSVSLYKLYSHFPVYNKMLCIRLEQLRKDFIEIINKSSNEIPKDFERITYLLKIYDLILTNYNDCTMINEKKEF